MGKRATDAIAVIRQHATILMQLFRYRNLTQPHRGVDNAVRRCASSRSTIFSGWSLLNIFTTKLFQPCARAVSSIESVISTENGVVMVSSANTPIVFTVVLAPRIFFAGRWEHTPAHLPLPSPFTGFWPHRSGSLIARDTVINETLARCAHPLKMPYPLL